MNTKHLQLTLIFLLFGLFTAIAQQRPEPKPGERIEQLKIAFLTRQIDLTPDEARQFWPLYNNYQKILVEQRDNQLETMREMPADFEAMTDADINQMVDSRMSQAETIHKARVEFLLSIREFLPPVKVARYFRAEEQFRRQALERLRERQEGRGGPGRR